MTIVAGNITRGQNFRRLQKLSCDLGSARFCPELPLMCIFYRHHLMMHLAVSWIIFKNRIVVMTDAIVFFVSRFSAFVLRDAEYIIKTTHPSNPEQPTAAGLESFFAEYKVKNLKVHEHSTSHDGEKGKVKFTYTQKMIRGGSSAKYTESSDFKRDKDDGGRWKYLSGIVS